METADSQSPNGTDSAVGGTGAGAAAGGGGSSAPPLSGTGASPGAGASSSGGGDDGSGGGTNTAAYLFHADFEGLPNGAFTQAQVAGEFGQEPPWNDGLDEGRAAVLAEADTSFLRVTYPGGLFGPGDAGVQFAVPLGNSYDELYVSYRIRFGAGFEFVKGGKIPGLCGGACNIGGDKPTGSDGWSARMMWRTGGNAVQYMYHPDQAGTYGDDFQWDLGGQRVFQPGSWHTVQTRIVMNTPGQADGVVQSWFDGELALDRSDVRFRDVSDFAIDTFYFSTFFGGGDASWAPSDVQTIDYDDVIVSTKPI